MSMIFIGLIIIVLAGLFIAGAAASQGAGQGGEVKQTMSLKKAYLYLVSVISLVILVIGGIQLIDMGLKSTVFKKADRDYYGGVCVSSKVPNPDGRMAECTPEEEARQRQQMEDNRAAQRQRQASTALSMIIVAAPVWWFHWRLARQEA